MVELKRDYLSAGEAKDQVYQYIAQVAQHSSKSSWLFSDGQPSGSFRLEKRGFGWEVVQGRTFDMFAPGNSEISHVSNHVNISSRKLNLAFLFQVR
jgi:hypothetical protein